MRSLFLYLSPYPSLEGKERLKISGARARVRIMHDRARERARERGRVRAIAHYARVSVSVSTRVSVRVRVHNAPACVRDRARVRDISRARGKRTQKSPLLTAGCVVIGYAFTPIQCNGPSARIAFTFRASIISRIAPSDDSPSFSLTQGTSSELSRSL